MLNFPATNDIALGTRKLCGCDTTDGRVLLEGIYKRLKPIIMDRQSILYKKDANLSAGLLNSQIARRTVVERPGRNLRDVGAVLTSYIRSSIRGLGVDHDNFRLIKPFLYPQSVQEFTE